MGGDSFIHATVQEQKPWIRISSLQDPAWNGQENSCCPIRIGRRLRLT